MNLLIIAINYDILFLVVNVLAIVNLLVLTLFLLISKRNYKANYILAAIVFLPITNFSFNILLLSGIVFNYPKLLLFTTSAVNSTFPLLFYLYLRMITGKSIKKFSIYIPWFLLFFATIAFQTYFVSLSYDEQVRFIKQIASGVPPNAFIAVDFSFFIVTLVYGLMSVVLGENSYRSSIKEHSDNLLKVRFVRLFSRMFLLLSLIIVLFYIFVPYKWIQYVVTPIAMNIIFFVIVFFAQRSAVIFYSSDGRNTSVINNEIGLQQKLLRIKKLYPKINVEGIFKIIENEIEDEFFLNSNMSLTFLSEKHNLPANHISIFVKEMYGFNFTEFVNKFRVEYAKKLLKENAGEKLSMGGIGLMSGFNSRTSFYRLFKKFTSQTPAEFLSNLKDNS